ncbi:MAG: hypothetical protein ABT940_00650 [Alphaproteobacteria bacterium]
MADVATIAPGRWGFSRIVQKPNGGFTTAAMQQGLASAIAAYYPPRVAGGYAAPYAAIKITSGILTTPTSDTILLPRDLALADMTLGDLTALQRTNLRNFLETWAQYDFTDWDGTIRSIPGFLATVQTYTTTTTVRQVLRDVYRYLGHSTDRPKPILFESHNTEYTDDFSSDPFSAPRWTNDIATAVWDSTNSELDMSYASAWPGCRYSVNDAGSIEHEAQVTSIWNGEFGATTGAAVRMDNAAAQDWYMGYWDRTNIILGRLNGGSETDLTTFAFTATANDFVTQRIAASGSAGNNVALSMWRTTHGASKPSDPGWYGTDGSPDETYTDTSVDRLDAASHLDCGIAGHGEGADYDSRSDFFKLRAISDRAGAGRTTRNTRSAPLGVNVGMNWRM